MKSIGHTVDGLQHAKRFGLVTHQTLSGVDTQVQLQRSVDLVVALVVTLGAFEIAQVLIAQAKAQAALVVRQRSNRSAIQAFSALCLALCR